MTVIKLRVGELNERRPARFFRTCSQRRNVNIPCDTKLLVVTSRKPTYEIQYNACNNHPRKVQPKLGP